MLQQLHSVMRFLHVICDQCCGIQSFAVIQHWDINLNFVRGHKSWAMPVGNHSNPELGDGRRAVREA